VSTLMEACDVRFSYGSATPALRGITLEFSQGSMTAIIGANGSGKSTLIRLLAGLLKPESGTIRLEGKSLREWDPRARARRIAYVPQAMLLAFPFPALDVVLSGRTPHMGTFQLEGDADRAKAMEALETVGAAHLASRYVTALSGGERQMVMLARALAQEPKLLLLDEPSASLDLKHRAALIRTLARLRADRGVSVIMVTHDLQLTSAAFDRIVALRCGEIAAEGAPAAVLERQLLVDIFGDPGIQALRVGEQTVIWTEL
jgi:iron complex transport system ATP-binding protein